jgi:hypothetical protein
MPRAEGSGRGEGKSGMQLFMDCKYLSRFCYLAFCLQTGNKISIASKFI